MKIFFTSSFEGKKHYQKNIDKIIEIIESTGAVVISPEKTREYQDAFRNENLKKLGDKEKIHYEFIRQGIANSDAVIIEASHEDFQIGHEATLAIIYKKPVLCLSTNKDFGQLIRHEEFKGVKYKIIDLNKILLDFLRNVSKRISSERNKEFVYSKQITYPKIKIEKHNVVVLGGISIDIVSKVPHIPKIQEELLSEGLKIMPGGKATNATISLSRLGEQVFMLSKIGNDFFGEQATNLLQKSGVNIDYIDIDSFMPTGTVIVTVDEAGKNTVIVNEDSNIRINQKTIEEFLKKIDNKTISIDCFYTTLEPLPKIIDFAIKEFSKRNKLIFCDATPRARPLNPKLYNYIDFLSANELETTMMSGIRVYNEKTAGEAALKLRENGAKNIIITLGSLGAVLLQNNSLIPQYFPGKKVRVIDETGAGDAFRGGFISEYLKEKNITKSMIFANTVGAYAVTKLGAFEGMPTREQLQIHTIR